MGHLERASPTLNETFPQRICARGELVRSLRRVERQVGALTEMVERGDPCVDLLTTIASARAELRCAGMLLIENYTRSYVTGALANRRCGDDLPREFRRALEIYKP